MEVETRTPLSSNKIIGISVLLGPLFGLIPLLFSMVIGIIAYGASPNFGLIIPTMLLGAYVMGFVPALVGGMIFSVLRKVSGHGYLTAFLSGFVGCFAFLSAHSGIGSFSVIFHSSKLSLTLGAIPAILLFAVAVKALNADISAFRKPLIPVRIMTAIPLAFGLYLVQFFLF